MTSDKSAETPASDPGASEETAYERGAATMRRVYGDIVPVLPEGVMAFNDIMVRTIFGEVWTRESTALSLRERRLLIMGVIVAFGQSEVWRTQARAALANGELTPDELRETLIQLAPYAGYPNVGGLPGICEAVIHEHNQRT